MPAKMTIGPVIGKVTSDTARVLVESDRDARGATCVARSAGHTARAGPIDLPRGSPRAFELAGLQPDTEYRLEFERIDAAVEGRVRTPPANPVSMNVAAVSCNFTPRRGDTDLWGELRDRYAGDLDLILHAGDQVYGDSAFEEALGILDGRATGTHRQELRILEAYRRLYRSTWSHPPTRETLARVANLMIWDDHEIRDGWGSRAADRMPGTPEHYVGTLARRVYREYQRQLWETPKAPPASGSEHHHHTWGPIGVLLVDQRGGRSFEPDPARPYLGRGQWEDIRSALEPGGAMHRVRALIVVTSVPLVYLGPDLTSLGARAVDDLEDHWSYAPHQTEQIEMLRALRRWKQREPARRELLVVGGDVHLGGYSEIHHLGQPIFRQLIASPITSRPPSWLEFQGIRSALEVQQRLGERYSFEHRELTRQRNFGLIAVRIPAAGRPIVDGSLVEAV